MITFYINKRLLITTTTYLHTLLIILYIFLFYSKDYESVRWQFSLLFCLSVIMFKVKSKIERKKKNNRTSILYNVEISFSLRVSQCLSVEYVKITQLNNNKYLKFHIIMTMTISTGKKW